MLPPLQIVVENDYGGKMAVPLEHQLGYMTCYANNNNGPRWFDKSKVWNVKGANYDTDTITHASCNTTSTLESKF